MQACVETVGRRMPEKLDTLISDPFLNDYAKILNSRAFRRLAYKTQVMSFPDNPHVRTRLVHTNEVIAVAIAIAEQLGLNKNLCMAIAAGHDIGHTPYGHVGEKVLSKFGGNDFKHYINSVVVAQEIERRCTGLNLAFETLEGILNHSRGPGELFVNKDLPQEYAVVMFSDKIAYTFSDLNDAIRYGYLDPERIPDSARDLGGSQRRRTKTVVDALVRESKDKDHVSFSEGEEFEMFSDLKRYMYENVYFKTDWRVQEQVLIRLCEFFDDYISRNPELKGIPPEFPVSLLTDQEANYYAGLLLKSRKPEKEQIAHFGVWEIMPHLKGKEIDYTLPGLDWKDQSFKQP